MNELMITFLENDWLLYAACGAAGAGGLIQIILSVIYNRSLNASERMRSTKIAWLRQMKARYESGYEWNNRIRNVELFVDKNIGRRKWMGLYLKTWEELSRMMVPLVLVLAVLGAVCAGTYMEDQTMPLVYLVTGATLILALRGLITLANLKEKQSLLRTNLCDYFENTLQGEAKNRRRESESYFGQKAQREEMACAVVCAERGMDKGTETGGTEADTSAEDKIQTEDRKNTAAGQMEVQPDGKQEESIDLKLQRKQEAMKNKTYRKEVAKKAKMAAKSNKAILRKEKKQAKQLANQEKREAKIQNKQEKKAAREEAKRCQKQKKEQKRVDKLTKRMEKMQLALGTVATTEFAAAHSGAVHENEEKVRLKREELKRKVDVTPAQEDQIISEVLREFLA